MDSSVGGKNGPRTTTNTTPTTPTRRAEAALQRHPPNTPSGGSRGCGFKSQLLILGSLSLVALWATQGRQLMHIMATTTTTTAAVSDQDMEKTVRTKKKEQRQLEHLANVPQTTDDHSAAKEEKEKPQGQEPDKKSNKEEEEEDFTSIPASSAKPPLNILLLYGDDWRFDTLGLENPLVKTPNLDKLARRGVRFTHNCVTTSVCWTSRTTLATGQYMSRHGLEKLSQRYEGAWNETWYSLLHQRANYHTAYVGKWGVLGLPPRGQVDSPSYNVEEVGWHRKTLNRPDPFPPAPHQFREYHITEVNEFDALNYLVNVQPTLPPDKPFVLTVAFFAPHAVDGDTEQYLPQNYSHPLYQDATIPVPSTMTDQSFSQLPQEIFNEINEGRIRYRWRYDTPEKHQTMMKRYYRLVSEVDATCGKLLQQLDERGLRNSTLVLFTTDNGYYQGEHGLADKWFPHQESIRVPLIIDDPRLPPPMRGRTLDDLTLNVDLAPTLLAAAGLETPPWMQGRDMTELYLKSAAQTTPPQEEEERRRRRLQTQDDNNNKDDPDSKWAVSETLDTSTWRRDFFYEHAKTRHNLPASEALVRKEWKYVYWPDINVEQLFDLQEDPLEEQDLLPLWLEYQDPEEARVPVQQWNFTWKQPQPAPWDLWKIRRRFLQLKQDAK